MADCGGRVARPVPGCAPPRPVRSVDALTVHRAHQGKQRDVAGARLRDHGLVFTSAVGTQRNANNVLRSFRVIVGRAGLNTDDWTPREMCGQVERSLFWVTDAVYQAAWHGSNHSPDNISIHFPGHDTLMFIDVVNAGWVPIYNVNLSEDVQGYMAAPGKVMSYPWSHFICGHLGRLATREDVTLHQQYRAGHRQVHRRAGSC
jgi:hypothetical protein